MARNSRRLRVINGSWDSEKPLSFAIFVSRSSDSSAIVSFLGRQTKWIEQYEFQLPRSQLYSSDIYSPALVRTFKNTGAHGQGIYGGNPEDISVKEDRA
ncbi:hypothetical protein TWF102_011302 [Orbilia oligospora]|uniref:Uncharacterized protein n=1 Tax=Orbilia oligospora TaxID=2813651 RepID=A0A7C8NP99_ORBOL|nr:hypothetical protein TWF103_003965 [Orbilia oligospora]KAF3085130.1 hypothetical protein TWF706_000573 [Orbilia oligospora]KAF3085673.1 hypothetical protein TWF102_011302 [Orbilia oligospora]KAF3123685.1 hypothetical protein TWF703_000672 [Orbilia oligospora]KAF3127170.1 hypothetical protein TWF594_000765 [Orbilia oligospora]